MASRPGFARDENLFEYRLERDPRCLRRIEQARNAGSIFGAADSDMLSLSQRLRC
jgi:hypothetical protein